MKRNPAVVLSGAAAAFALSAFALAQAASGPSPTPGGTSAGVSPTSAVAPMSTPAIAPRTTPSSVYGSAASGTPPSGRRMMHTTPAAGAAGPGGVGANKHPMKSTDCANDGWRTYTNPTFKTQQECDHYVRSHQSTKAKAKTPRAKMSSGAKSATTPGS